MTDERRQDAMLIAIVVSLIAHAALMCALQTQVMTVAAVDFRA